MNSDDLKNCLDSIVPDPAQKQKMLNMILENGATGVKPVTRKIKRMTLATAVIAVTALITVTAAIAAGEGLHEKLREFFNIGAEQIGLVEKSLDTPEASVTQNGVTLTVKQTIADSQGVFVLWEITSPEGVDLTVDGLTTRYGYLDVPFENRGYGSMVGGDEFLEQSANHLTGLSSISSSAPIESGTITLYLRDLGYFTSDMEFVVLAEGEWSVSWEFILEDIGKTLEPNQPVSVGGTESIITKISVSPISIYASATGANPLGAGAKINLRDSSEITFNSTDENFSSGGSLINFDEVMNDGEPMYEYHMYYRFDRVINPDDVVSITVCGVTIPIK